MALDQHFDDLEERRDKEMSFIEHLEELRWHLIRSVIAIGVIAIATFTAKRIVFDHLIFGPINPSFPTYRWLCTLSERTGIGKAFCIESFDFNIINVEVAGQFLVHLKVAIVLGLILSFPYVFWEIWRFVRPALHEKERKNTRGVVFWASLLFLTGISFGYLILTPFSINFFSNYGVSDMVNNEWKLTNYVSVITMITMASGILFELPMVVYIFSRIGLLTPKFMRSHRRHAFIITLIIAALITPADVGTQILVSIPVIFLYEISIGICARVYKKRQKQLA
jgi:sec-independent protein translocase protein TatC